MSGSHHLCANFRLDVVIHRYQSPSGEEVKLSSPHLRPHHCRDVLGEFYDSILQWELETKLNPPTQEVGGRENYTKSILTYRP